MEKIFVCVLLFILTAGVVIASSWGDIDNGKAVPSSSDLSINNNIVSNVGSAANSNFIIKNESKNHGSWTFYTANFYIAMGLILFVLVILAVFIWFFIRGPRNKWEK